METEELKLLRENNILLKQIYQILISGRMNDSVRDFIINFSANMLSDSINGKVNSR